MNVKERAAALLETRREQCHTDWRSDPERERTEHDWLMSAVETLLYAALQSAKE
jgi:hypothetical protein